MKDGSEIELRICPGCGEQRHPVQFRDEVGVTVELCSMCRACGPCKTAGSWQQAAGREQQQGETMGEMVTCDICGKEVKRHGLGVHRAKKHGIPGAKHGVPRPTVPAVRKHVAQVVRPAATRGDVEIVTDGLTLPDVVRRIQQHVADGQTALRVIAELTGTAASC